MNVIILKKYLLRFACLMVFFLSAPSKLTAAPAGIKVFESVATNPVNSAIHLIYQGKFEAADELMKQFNPEQYPKIKQLAQIVQVYKNIVDQRNQTRKTEYDKSLVELEKLRINSDTNDTNDANDATKVISIIARICEFADKEQKKRLISDTYVKQNIQKAMDKAAEYESEGKWFDAYITCYRWLQVIDKDNEAYSDYSEQLVDKANIVASFQDSACETRRERYQGVKKNVFIKAIDVLNSNYVSDIDYHQMAIKAIRRCELLGQVMALSFSEISKSWEDASLEQNVEKFFEQPDSDELANWSTALKLLLKRLLVLQIKSPLIANCLPEMAPTGDGTGYLQTVTA